MRYRLGVDHHPHLLGRFLEAKAKGRTSKAIKRLMGYRQKPRASSATANSSMFLWKTCAAATSCRFAPATRSPVHGEVLGDSCYIDESMISSEPVPVSKKRGLASRRRHHQQDGQLHLPCD
jgi:Au+-exporting ATPase